MPRFKNVEYEKKWDECFLMTLRDIALLLFKADYSAERAIGSNFNE